MDEAEALSHRAVQVRERTLGPDAPETAIALATLGEVLAKKGEPAAAETLLRRALAVQQQCLAADNPDTGLTLWHLAERRSPWMEFVPRPTRKLGTRAS
jgi:kinesin light chain